MIAVSACLVGKNTKYDGKNNKNEYVLKYLENKEYILICPEVLGGLLTPRTPSEIKGKKVINKDGKNVTRYFKKGARIAYKLLKKNKVDTLIVKENSPSCGYKNTYDGTFSHTLVNKPGMFTRKIKNIKIYNEKMIEDLLK